MGAREEVAVLETVSVAAEVADGKVVSPAPMAALLGGATCQQERAEALQDAA